MIGIFLLLEICISFILGFFNLLGLNSSISTIILFIINILIFFIIGFKNGKKTNKKGFIEGLLTGSILIFILFLLSLIIFHKSLSLGSLFYYLSLLFTSVISSTIGKNKKNDSIQQKN